MKEIQHPAADMLSAEGIRGYLTEKAAPYGKRLSVFDTVDSTNQMAKEWAAEGSPHGTVIVADRQTRGRGRYHRRFESPTGGLYMSLILEPPQLPFPSVTFMTSFAAVAVSEAVEEVTGRLPDIKWVNDVLLDGKKVCGILTEGVTHPQTGAITRLVVGIGVNIHERKADFPEELREIAASLDPEWRIPDIRNRLAAGIISRLLAGDGVTQAEVLARYRSRLSMLGREVTVIRVGQEPYRGTAVDLDPDGALIVRREDGSLDVLSTGEIHVRETRPSVGSEKVEECSPAERAGMDF